MQRRILAYVPVLHRSYQEFFQKFPDAELYLLKREELLKIPQFDYLKKDLRALDSKLIIAAIKSWQIFKEVKEISLDQLTEQAKEWQKTVDQIISPNDDIGRFLKERYFSDNADSSLLLSSYFLRWDKYRILTPQEVHPKMKISKKAFEKKLMHLAFDQANFSSDWWRQVGALAVKNQKVLLAAFNQQVPSRDQQNQLGDPRNFFSSGEEIEYSSSIHAEAALIADAARRGISLEGSSLYCNTFPCPVCAKQIAYSGIKKLYFATAYAKFDGIDILEKFGVEVIQIIFSKQELAELEAEKSQYSQAKVCYQLKN